MSDNNIAIQVHCLYQNRHDEFLYYALLLVIDGGSHMRALFDIVALDRRVGDCLVVGNRPIVVEKQHAVE